MYLRFMEKQTVEKLTVVGEDFLHLLTEHIDENQIPKYFGGRSNMPVENGSISFEHFTWESDMIAKVGVDSVERLQLEPRGERKMNTNELLKRASNVEKGARILCTFVMGFLVGMTFGTVVNLYFNDFLL